MERIDEQVARWAVGPGLDVVAEATAALDAGETELAIASRLRRTVPHDRAAFALAAAVARRRARAAGVAGADRLVLTREGQEQASHPAVAAWRAQRAASVVSGAEVPGPVVDLCAGTGADAVALAAAAGPVVAVERDPGRAVLAAHRAAVLGADVEVVVGDALERPVVVSGRLVHADPDRRDHQGRRARSLDRHGPPVPRLLEAVVDAAAVMVTVAPGTAWDDPGLPADCGVTFVEHADRLVEAVVELGAAATARARAVRAGTGEVLERRGEVDRLPVGDLAGHLLLPSPALVRARLHDLVGGHHGAVRVADRRALLSADAPVDDPWVACERVLAVLPPRARALRDWLRSSDARALPAVEGGVEVLTHGLDRDPVRFLRDAHAPSGPHGVRVHLVRRDRDAVAVVTLP